MFQNVWPSPEPIRTILLIFGKTCYGVMRQKLQELDQMAEPLFVVLDARNIILRLTQKTVKHGGGSTMVCGAFSWHGVGPLVKINGKMDKFQYLDILKKKTYGTIRFGFYAN